MRDLKMDLDNAALDQDIRDKQIKRLVSYFLDNNQRHSAYGIEPVPICLAFMTMYFLQAATTFG